MSGLRFLWLKIKALATADLRSLALMRVGVGVLLIIDLLHRLTDFRIFYTDAGVVTRNDALSMLDSRAFSLYFASGSEIVIGILFAVQLIAAFSLLIGFKTRISAVISWILLASLQARNIYVYEGLDQVLRLTLFWGIFLPWGQRFSIDSMKYAFQNRTNTYASLFVLGYFLQIAYIYSFAALHKFGPEWVKDANAVYYTLQLDQFTSPIAKYFLAFPDLLSLLTRSVLIFELWGPLLLFMPFLTQHFRMLGTFLFMGMQASFGTILSLGLFPPVNIVALMGLLPTLFWEKFFSIVRKMITTDITIYYDSDCGFCEKSIRFLRTFVTHPSVATIPAQKNARVLALMQKNSSWVVERKGKHFFAWDAFIQIISASPLFFWVRPVLSLALIRSIGNTGYYAISRNRHVACEYRPQTVSHDSLFLRLLSAPIAVFLILYITAWNIGTLPNAPTHIRQELTGLGVLLRVDQTWDMFAPSPFREDGWFVMPATLADGSVVDVMTKGGNVTWDKPKNVRNTFKNYRWRRYLTWVYTNEEARAPFVSYMCSEWNKAHTPENYIRNMEIYYMREMSQPDHTQVNVEKLKLYESGC